VEELSSRIENSYSPADFHLYEDDVARSRRVSLLIPAAGGKTHPREREGHFSCVPSFAIFARSLTSVSLVSRKEGRPANSTKQRRPFFQIARKRGRASRCRAAARHAFIITSAPRKINGCVYFRVYTHPASRTPSRASLLFYFTNLQELALRPARVY